MSLFRNKPDDPTRRVEVLELRPSDTLVVEVHEWVTRAQADHVRQQFTDYFGKETRIIVVQNASLKVLREGDPPPPPVVIS